MVAEYYVCDDCGWWVPRPYRVYDIISSTGQSEVYVMCKWCDEGENWQLDNRNYFRYCCGKNGLGPDAGSSCTYCGWRGHFGDDVPDHCILTFVARRKKFDLLCQRCYYT